ncbi:MAG: YHYH domain-containing protein [Thiolinea sp.]
MRLIARIAPLILVIAPTTLFSHGGGLNSEGCHNNRRTGDYHCHRSSYRPAPTPSYTAPSYPAPSYLYSAPAPVATPSLGTDEKLRLLATIASLESSVSDLKAQNAKLSSGSKVLFGELERVNALEDKVQTLEYENRQLRSARPQPQRVAGNNCQIQLNALKASYEQKLASVRRAPVNNHQPVINLNSLHSLEQMNVRLACSSVSGAANYNRCIQQQVQALQSAPRLR